MMSLRPSFRYLFFTSLLVMFWLTCQSQCCNLQFGVETDIAAINQLLDQLKLLDARIITVQFGEKQPLTIEYR